MAGCGECGFEYDLARSSGAAGAIVDGAAQLAGLVATAPDVHVRRQPDLWSPLEYACHVRDVLLVQRERVLAARRVDRPSFDPMGRDDRVEHEGYSEQDPIAVARQLGDAASMLANVFGRLGPADWARIVVYNYPAEFEESLRWVAVHTEHEVKHHLLDVRRQLEE